MVSMSRKNSGRLTPNPLSPDATRVSRDVFLGKASLRAVWLFCSTGVASTGIAASRGREASLGVTCRICGTPAGIVDGCRSA